MNSSDTKTSDVMDMNVDNITENTILINSQTKDERVKYLFERLVTHLHDFARETRLSTSEWKTALDFLVSVGQISSDVRHEFILLSDVLGLSLLVDAIDHPKPQSSTEGSLLGPFHSHEAESLAPGADISSDPKGKPCLVVCRVRDQSGGPIEGVKIDIWETDSSGHYDVQYSERDGPDGRCVMTSDAQGVFYFKAIVPVSYPIPNDGPVGRLLKLLNRHPWRPAHMHFILEKKGWDSLITALYIRPDPYLTSDAVFGVKHSLIESLGTVSSEQAKEYGVQEGTALITREFVLVSKEETEKLRDANAMKAMAILFPGRKIKLLDHLPVPDLD